MVAYLLLSEYEMRLDDANCIRYLNQFRLHIHQTIFLIITNNYRFSGVWTESLDFLSAWMSTNGCNRIAHLLSSAGVRVD